MKSLRIPFFTASLTTFLLIGFFLYQYFWLNNSNVVLSLDKFSNNRVLSAFLLLTLYFTFIMGLISFLPSLINIYKEQGLKSYIPFLVSIFNILVSLYIAFKFVVPVQFT